MRSKKRQAISSGSMADIAFLLLVFWLMTTSLSTEQGIMQLLPPIDSDSTKVNNLAKDVFDIYVNRNDEILLKKDLISIYELKHKTKEFLCNGGVFKDETANSNFSEREWVDLNFIESKIKSISNNINKHNGPSQAQLDSLKGYRQKKDAISFFGPYKELRPMAIISINNDKKTNYELYVGVQNELVAALNELRDELSLTYFKKHFKELDKFSEQDKINAIRKVYPYRISEAEIVN